MLATTPLFYAYNWPRRALAKISCGKLGNNTAVDAADATNPGLDNDGDDGGGEDEKHGNATTTNKV